MNVWKEAQDIIINNYTKIPKGFIYEYNDNIPNDMKKTLSKFMNWVEEQYPLATPLYVKFIYTDYLIHKNDQKVGFIFHWCDYSKYPNIYDANNLPTIELPVKEGKWKKEAIITSFIEGLTLYFHWIMNDITDDTLIDYSIVDYILNKYKKTYEFI